MNIVTMTQLAKNLKEHIEAVGDKKIIAITKHGKAVAYMVDVEYFLSNGCIDPNAKEEAQIRYFGDPQPITHASNNDHVEDFKDLNTEARNKNAE